MCKVAPSWRVARARVRSSTHRGVSSCSQPLMAQRAGEVPRPRSNAYLDRLVLDSIEGTWWLIGGVRSAAAGGPRADPGRDRAHAAIGSAILRPVVPAARAFRRIDGPTDAAAARLFREGTSVVSYLLKRSCVAPKGETRNASHADDTSLPHTAHHVRRTRRARRQPQRRTA